MHVSSGAVASPTLRGLLCMQISGGEKEQWATDAASGPLLPANELAGAEDVPKGRMVIFRDRNGWCPYSERVWFAMLEKRLSFDEVLINLQVGTHHSFLYQSSHSHPVQSPPTSPMHSEMIFAAC